MNLIEQLDAMGLEYREHSSRADEIYINCPFCEEEGETPDTRFRLGVNVADGIMGCFNCGKKSRNADYTWKELQRALDTGTLEAAANLVKKTPKRPVTLPPDFTRLKNGGEHWNNVALRYLATRNISSKQIREKNIGYSTVGEFRYRIIVPVYYKGKLEGIVARAFVVGLEPKYKNSMGQKVIYNVPDKPRDTIVLSEGAFDALVIEKTMRRRMDSGAILGHSLTDKQMEQLEPYQNVILWPDPDAVGVSGFIRIAQQLQDAKKNVEMVLPELNKEEYDPSELWPVEVHSKIINRVPFTYGVALQMKAALAFQED